MCVICVQLIANAQGRQLKPYTPVEVKEELQWQVKRYQSVIQSYLQEIGNLNAELEVQWSALQGESCHTLHHTLLNWWCYFNT